MINSESEKWLLTIIPARKCKIINSFIPNKKKDMEVTCIMSEYQAIDSSHPDYCMPKATPGNFVYELFGETFSR